MFLLNKSFSQYILLLGLVFSFNNTVNADVPQTGDSITILPVIFADGAFRINGSDYLGLCIDPNLGTAQTGFGLGFEVVGSSIAEVLPPDGPYIPTGTPLIIHQQLASMFYAYMDPALRSVMFSYPGQGATPAGPAGAQRAYMRNPMVLMVKGYDGVGGAGTMYDIYINSLNQTWPPPLDNVAWLDSRVEATGAENPIFQDFYIFHYNTIGSSVFSDINDNGIQDGGESGISGVTVELWFNGSMLDNTTTDGSGNYFFNFLINGDYQLRIPVSNFGAGKALENLTYSSTDIGTTNGDNQTDGDDNGLQAGGSGSQTISPTITLTAGSEPEDGGTETAQGNAQDTTAPAGDATGYILDDSSGDMTIDFGFVVFPLPVELSYFGVESTNAGVLAKWTTESETENLGFTLDRRVDGTDSWSEITSYAYNDALLGQGSTPSATDYEYLDALVTAGTTYEYRLADVDYGNVVTYHATRTVTVASTPSTIEVPAEFTVKEAYPNPFNPSTTIEYALPVIASGAPQTGQAQQSQVSLQIYDITGKLINTLIDQVQPSGWHSVQWNGKDQVGANVPAGAYLVRVKAGTDVRHTKVMLLK